jgi:DNA-binding NarL/FixJ family response regulator
VLSCRLGVAVIAAVGDVIEALPILESAPPTLIAIDRDSVRVGLPCTLRAVQDVSPKTRVLLVGESGCDANAAAACARHAAGCVFMSDKHETVRQVITDVLAGRVALRREVCGRPANPGGNGEPVTPLPGGRVALTRCELRVLRQLATGLAVREIAAQLQVAPRTVDTHMCRIMKKLDIHDRVHLALFAVREGLVALPANHCPRKRPTKNSLADCSL